MHACVRGGPISQKYTGIIFSHENMKNGGLWLFQKISSPRAASFAGPSLGHLFCKKLSDDFEIFQLPFNGVKN